MALVRSRFSQDGKILASGSGHSPLDEHGTVQLWDVATHAQIGKPLVNPGNNQDTFAYGSVVTAVAFSPHGGSLAVADSGNGLQLWNVATHTKTARIASIYDSVAATSITAMDFNPAGTVLATGDSSNNVRLWNVATGAQIGPTLNGYFGDNCDVRSLAFNPGGTILASAGNDRTIRLWSIATHTQITPPLIGDTAPIESVIFNGKGTLLASASLDRTVRVWNTSTHSISGQPLVAGGDGPCAVSFASNGKTLTAINGAGSTTWNLATHAAISNIYVVNNSKYFDFTTVMSISPDGKEAAACDLMGGTIWLWHLNQ